MAMKVKIYGFIELEQLSSNFPYTRKTWITRHGLEGWSVDEKNILNASQLAELIVAELRKGEIKYVNLSQDILDLDPRIAAELVAWELGG